MTNGPAMISCVSLWPQSVLNQTSLYVDLVWSFAEAIDVDYLKWVLWVIYPIIFSFVLPLSMLVFFYASALFLQVYKQRQRLRDAYARDFWDGARYTLAVLWHGQGRIWHGYDTVGLEKLPKEGAALIIYYHGVIPIDMYYMVTKTIILTGRHIRVIGDRFLLSVPGWRQMMDVFCVMPGTVQSCVDVLRQGYMMCISPGGVREALFGDEYYMPMWGKREGFAKIAIQAGVPVIPMFTKNCREAFRTPGWGRYWLRKLYEKTRLPIVPIYGGFPVKLRTYLGDPIYPEQGDTPEEFAKKIQTAVAKLIEEHQRIPGNILHGLMDRVYLAKEAGVVPDANLVHNFRKDTENEIEDSASCKGDDWQGPTKNTKIVRDRFPARRVKVS